MKRLFVVFGVLGILTVCMGLIVFSFMAQGQAAAKKLEEKKAKEFIKVEKGELVVTVVETGNLEAFKTVEVKSRVGGRIARLLVDEGDYVKAGDLIAVVDPQETELQVKQNQAQLRGAQSSVARQALEIKQQKALLTNAVNKAKIRISQLEQELKAQPTLTNTNIRSAQTAVTSAQKAHDLLVNVTQPNNRVASQNAVEDAQNNLQNAILAEDRQNELYRLGYSAKANLEQAQLQRKLASTRLEQAKQSLSRLDNEQKLERDRSLQAIAQAQAQLDAAKANGFQDDTKRKQLESARADLKDAQTQLQQIGILEESRRGSMASVDQISSVLGDSLRQLGETEIRAPFSGIISKRAVQVGELVSALSTFSTGTAIVTLEDRSSMLVKLQINEIDVARLAEGMKVDIAVDAFSNENYTGTITKIAPSQFVNAQGVATDAVVKYELEIRLDSVSDKLKGGMSAKCTMKAVNLKDVLRLPIEFVGQDENGRFVMKAAEGKDKAGSRNTVRTNVVVGPASGKYIQIISGVTEGEEVKKPDYKGPDRRGMMSFGSEDEEENKDSSSSSSSSSQGN